MHPIPYPEPRPTADSPSAIGAGEPITVQVQHDQRKTISYTLLIHVANERGTDAHGINFPLPSGLPEGLAFVRVRANGDDGSIAESEPIAVQIVAPGPAPEVGDVRDVGSGTPDKPTIEIVPGIVAPWPPLSPASDAYYNWLVQHPAMQYAYDFTTAASCDAVPDNATGPGKVPTEFDPRTSALLQWTDPRAGHMNPCQKSPKITTRGASLFLTWEFLIGEGCRFTSAGCLPIVKAWRLDGPDQQFFLAAKLWFSRAANRGPDGCIAEFVVTSQTKAFLGPGTGREGEVLTPYLGHYYCDAAKLYRGYAFLDGNVGDGALSKLSVWVADDAEVVQLYDELLLYTPAQGLDRFRFEFNTSAASAANPRMEYHDRHVVVLQGLTKADVPELLRTVVG